MKATDADLKRDGIDLPPDRKPAAGATTTPTIYTCKHHPDVVMDKPGECPKCHMTLIAKPD